MNFYSITIVRAGDCLRTVNIISETDDCLITEKKLALKIFNLQKKDLRSGDYIAILENGFCIKEEYL